MAEICEFESFPKIPRLTNVPVQITEKIDGTNAQITISEDGTIQVGSRNRWIYHDRGKADDNYGFAAWVASNAELLRRLGPGRHFGEWWWQGIGRNYGLSERRLSLFNAHRWNPEVLAERGLLGLVGAVPILATATLDTLDIPAIVNKLFNEGSVAVPGWAKPEGVVIRIGPQLIKITDNGNLPKWSLHAE